MYRGGYWDVIAVVRSADLTRLPATFDSAYEEIAADACKQFAFEKLNMHAMEASEYRFLQRKVLLPSPAPNGLSPAALDRALKECAPNCVFEHLEGMDFHFAVGMPYVEQTKNIPMNECVACYAVMYFLSSLVRYHPDYMDQIAESDDAWLIESFAKGVPLFLLRYLVSAIRGYSLVMMRSAG